MTILAHLSIFILILTIVLIYFILYLITENYGSLFRGLIKSRPYYEPLKLIAIWTIFIISVSIFIIFEIIFWTIDLLIKNIQL